MSRRFLELATGHWQVENRLHLVKDRWWDEDKHALFRPGVGRNMVGDDEFGVDAITDVGRQDQGGDEKGNKCR
ncbi:MAG: hypothetical protein FWE67_10985 [Planctomycetaceae bacterium]|nr:hypothetical protein [Planctomycetaceae bacterium]